MEQERYIDGVLRAAEAGHISYLDPAAAPLGPEDGYAHMDEKGGSLTYCNTRPLPPATIAAMTIADERRGPGEALRVLELGHGAGTAMAAMRRLFQGAVLHAIGLTPVNPYLMPKGGRQDAVNGCLRVPREILHDNGWSVDGLLELQRQRLADVFEVQDAPYIDRQVVGHLERARREDFSSDGYHVLAEHSGALRYATYPETGHAAPMRERLRICGFMYDLLAPGGVYVADTILPGNVQMLRRVLRPDDRLLRFVARDWSRVVLAKKGGGADELMRLLRPNRVEEL